MFFASIAHELRTPLNTIIPLSTRLLSIVEDQHSLKLIKLIKNTSMFLQSIIEDALDMNRLENNQFLTNIQNVDIRKAVDEVL